MPTLVKLWCQFTNLWLTMVNHGHQPWLKAWFNHGLTMVNHGWTMLFSPKTQFASPTLRKSGPHTPTWKKVECPPPPPGFYVTHWALIIIYRPFSCNKFPSIPTKSVFTLDSIIFLSSAQVKFAAIIKLVKYWKWVLISWILHVWNKRDQEPKSEIQINSVKRVGVTAQICEWT